MFHSNVNCTSSAIRTVVNFTKLYNASQTHRRPKLRAEPILTYDHLLTHRNITMSLNFFLCKIPIPSDASYVYDACNVLVKSYSKSCIVTTTHGIVLVKSTTGLKMVHWFTGCQLAPSEMTIDEQFSFLSQISN